MKNEHLNSLLHLADPTLPIGGFSHSNGLETYVQSGIIKDAASAETFVDNMLINNLQYNDGAFLRLAYEAANDSNLSELIRLDRECTALKSPKEIRQASLKLGARLLKIFQRRIEHELIDHVGKLIRNDKSTGHYCIVFGLCARLLDIPIAEALLAFYYNTAVAMVTNCVKLIPLGQLEGQDILFRIQSLLPQLVKQTLVLEQAKVGICNQGFDIRCMQHERLYSRLYMS